MTLLKSHLAAVGGVESFGVPSATTTPSPISQQSPNKKSKAGAIVGGVIGGVAFLGIVIIVVVWRVLRRTAPPRESWFSHASSAKTEQQGYTG